jgi:hypothetical protein
MDSTDIYQKIEKRTLEIEKILTEFLLSWNSNDSHVKIKCKSDSSKAIATIYYEIVNNNVKGEYFKEDGLINKFKVASISEIAAMLFMPLQFDDLSFKYSNASINKLNARFATTLGIQMLNLIHLKETTQNLPIIKSEITKAAVISHNYWVRFFDKSNSYSVYLNSNFWEMYFAALMLEK